MKAKSKKSSMAIKCCYENNDVNSPFKKSVTFIKECNTLSTNDPKHQIALAVVTPRRTSLISKSKSFDLTSMRRPSNMKSGSTSSQFSAGLAQKLKDSGRATIILVLISAFFVILNIPYIVVWANFFIPYKQEWLETTEAIYFRYAWVMLFEIFHMTNFCINLFLYCLASKLFRNELFARFSILKSCRISFSFKRNVTFG